MKNINKPYIIGETAFHHEGELDFLIELIDQAADLGLDAIKFHTLFDIQDYIVAKHEAIPILEKISLTKESAETAINHALKKGLEAIVLCNDVQGVDWVIEKGFDLRAIELHSTGLNDLFLLEKAAKFDNTVILGIGGSTLDEVKFAVDFLIDRGKDDILLMHGFQNYPTEYSDIYLDRIEKFGQLFDLPMGYADHTDPANEHNEWLSVLGLTKGAFVIEKHFTTRFGEKRIDAQSAISVDQMKKVKNLAQVVYETLGTKNPLSYSFAELKYGNTGPMKKAPVARTPIAVGEEITLEKIAFKRTVESSNIQQKDILKLIGLKANQDIPQDGIVDFSKVEFEFVVADTSQFKNTKK